MRLSFLAVLLVASCGQRHGIGDPLSVLSGDPSLAAGDRAGAGDGSAGDASGDSYAGDPGAAGDSYTGDPGAAGDSYAGDPGAAGDPGGGDPGGAGDPGAGEVWLEVNYRYRNPAESPATASWAASDTPGWSESNWAPEGSTWAYIHVPDGGNLTSDPIGGTVLELGCYDRFRLFFGLEELWHVGAATVTVEGRSRATSAGVDFEVWNPGGTSGYVAYGSMSNDWTADVVTVDFVAEAGDGFQAVEIAPIARSCSLAIRRVRLTLYDID